MGRLVARKDHLGIVIIEILGLKNAVMIFALIDALLVDQLWHTAGKIKVGDHEPR
jgi:hypothetical protein